MIASNTVQQRMVCKSKSFYCRRRSFQVEVGASSHCQLRRPFSLKRLLLLATTNVARPESLENNYSTFHEKSDKRSDAFLF